ncbi:oligopeptide transport ATP-binding protein OppF [Oxobacter pfennigii]|uniref:Oligopeptide transport ATP-binding protein OppF n=1 Tax=Oxobacter pfennigii TaxID=36849 RepID=A0A0P9ABK0_9CLOT|nr:oligopeptide/dipeptide ABC transporter ATP-binding protein [Oxobacter pfennigii]KPU42446.1 oligopeptide transport ATP-binding protein OppF [Oxobacter pfennigii]
MSKLLVEVISLKKKFPVYGPFGKLMGAKSYVNAISNVSFKLYEGETYGLVGESGSGKTTAGRAILGLTKVDSGKVLYKEHDLTKLSPKEFRPLRKDLQLVFQDPFSSLNPQQRIGSLLEEPLIIQKIGDGEQRREMVLEILDKVGLPLEHYFRFPHELSGGQIQRLGLARALIINPKVIVCDEPVSSLDVSIQAQILNMLNKLQKTMKLSMLFITHDISVVRYISTRIGVMYLGTIVEEALTDDLFERPLHPYTKALFSAVPDISSRKERSRIILHGEIPTHTDAFWGCAFHARCPSATEKCRQETPSVREVYPDHFTACHYV